MSWGSTKKLLAFMFVGLFLISFVSALTFDNRIRDYDEATKTVIIDDNFGLGGDLVKIQLLENTYTCLTECYTILNVTIYSNEDNFLTDLVFEQIKGMVSEHKFEYVTRYDEIIANDYAIDCSSKNEAGTCGRKVIGTHIESVPVYDTFNPRRKVDPGNYIIKLTGKKGKYDTVDWVASFFGKEIRQWAFWASSDPTSYWNFNEVLDSTQAIDFIGLHNLTVDLTRGNFLPGKLANGFNFSNSNNIILNTTGGSEFAFGTGDFTMAFWMNGTSGGANAFIEMGRAVSEEGWEIGRFNNNVMAFVSNGVVVFNSSVITWNDLWNRVVVVREGTGADQIKFYVNNVNTKNGTFATDVINNTAPLNIRGDGGGGIQIDDFQIYKGFAWTVSDVNEDYNGGAGKEANTSVGEITVVLNTPLNASIISGSSLSFNATGTPSLINITNATLRLYNSSTTLFDEVVNIMDTTTNETIFNITSMRIGNYIWNVEFCGRNTTSAICGQGVSNFTFTRTAIINQSVNFSNPTIEGSTETFVLNLTFNSSVFSISSATFIYNQTGSSSTLIGTGDNILITSSKVIPGVSADTNNSFFWNLSFIDTVLGGGATLSTTLNNQSILNLGVDNCAVFTNRILNFTVVDEELQTFIINATVETAINIFDSSRSNLIANLSNNLTNPVNVCMNLNLNTSNQYSLDVIARYEKPSEYANEYYNIVDSILNSTSTVQTIILYDLNVSDSTEFQLTFTGVDFLPVENALININRQYISENQFKTVELPKTDSNGQTILHLERNDVIYNIRIIKDKIIIGNFENIIAFCEDFTIGDCKINLNAEDSTEAVFNYNEDIGIIFTEPTYNNDTRIISFTFTTSDGTAKEVTMSVNNADIFGNRSICNDTLTSAGGTLSCGIPSSIEDSQLRTSIAVDKSLVLATKINLDKTNLGQAGFYVLFFMSLSFILMFSNSKSGILIGMIMGFVSGLGLSIWTGNLIGFGASGLWLLVIVAIGIWKLNKEKQG